MAITDNTELDVIVPERWRMETIIALYDSLQMGSRILNVTQDASGYGDIVNISASPGITVGDVTAATGAFTPSAYTPTNVQVTINQWRQASIEYTKKGYKQSLKDWFNKLPQEFGQSLAEDIENKILALESDVTNTVGDGSGDVGEAEVLAAIKLLGEAKLNPMRNPERFTFVFDWEQYPSLKTQKILSDAAYRGTAAGGTQTTDVPNIFGIPTFVTNQVADGTDGPGSAATKSNMLFEKHAFAWALAGNQMDFQQKDKSDALTTVMVMDYLAGFKANLVARAAKIPSAS